MFAILKIAFVVYKKIRIVKRSNYSCYWASKWHNTKWNFIVSKHDTKANFIQLIKITFNVWRITYAPIAPPSSLASGLVTSAPLALFHAIIIIGWGGAPLEWFFGPIIIIGYEKEIISAFGVFHVMEYEGEFAFPDFSSAACCFCEIFGVTSCKLV